MRDTANEINQLGEQLKPFLHTSKLLNGTLAMLTLCGWALTISTILWQWLG